MLLARASFAATLRWVSGRSALSKLLLLLSSPLAAPLAAPACTGCRDSSSDSWGTLAATALGTFPRGPSEASEVREAEEGSAVVVAGMPPVPPTRERTLEARVTSPLAVNPWGSSPPPPTAALKRGDKSILGLPVPVVGQRAGRVALLLLLCVTLGTLEGVAGGAMDCQGFGASLFRSRAEALLRREDKSSSGAAVGGLFAAVMGAALAPPRRDKRSGAALVVGGVAGVGGAAGREVGSPNG
jgi:hypothetical protein